MAGKYFKEDKSFLATVLENVKLKITLYLSFWMVFFPSNCLTSVYISSFLSVCFSIFILFCLSVSLSLCLFISLSISISVSLCLSSLSLQENEINRTNRKLARSATVYKKVKTNLKTFISQIFSLSSSPATRLYG